MFFFENNMFSFVSLLSLQRAAYCVGGANATGKSETLHGSVLYE